MKNKTLRTLFNLSLCLLAGAPLVGAETTTFTYQGRLTDSGSTANGSYDLKFRLYDAATGGAQIGGEYASPGVSVAHGLFTIPLDFGSGPFSGSRRWLE